jgi:hypothetical protein
MGTSDNVETGIGQAGVDVQVENPAEKRALIRRWSAISMTREEDS